MNVIRYFAGGSLYDTSVMFGTSYLIVLSCVWIIVDATNICHEFQISYPESLEEQRKVADGFQKVSNPRINNCAGALDGLVIWISKPSLMEATLASIGQKKFFCGCKNKFGLNCQAVSDFQGCILDFSI